VKTWLVGILKFKIIDALRSKARQPIPASDLDADGSIGDLEALFDETGTWSAKPRDWEQPGHELRQSDFDQVLEACLSKVPELPARVFMLREMFEMDAEEVCTAASVTRNHLNVLLYRARMALRRCLDLNWVTDGGSR